MTSNLPRPQPRVARPGMQPSRATNANALTRKDQT